MYIELDPKIKFPKHCIKCGGVINPHDKNKHKCIHSGGWSTSKPKNN